MERARIGIRVGDMVVCPGNRVGLLIELDIVSKLGAKVIFANGGPLIGFNWRSLRPATLLEISAAGLDGVGCNQGR